MEEHYHSMGAGDDERTMIYSLRQFTDLFEEVPPDQPGGYLASPPKDQLFLKLDPEGRLKQLWVFPKGDASGQLDWAHSMALGPDGSLYFAEVMAKRAQKFVPAGTLAREH